MKRAALAAFLAAIAAPAFAQAAAGGAAPICTDRPGKGNNACTVPAGGIQLETDLFNWTRMTAGGVRTDTILYTDPMLKLGLTGSSDLQVAIAPYEEVRTRTGHVTDRIGGVGDLFVRYKKRLTAADAGTQIALIPFVKAPTARRGLGNRKWEGGLAIPLGFDLGHDVSLGFSPEADLLADDDGAGRHFGLSNAVNLGKTIGKVTLAAELWGSEDFDPGGTVRQASADVMATWLARKNLQLDAGANFGLNRETPDVQLYAGISTRF